MTSPLRILQLVANTDAGPEQERALALHPALVERGQEVRTLALAPGRNGQLASTLPVLAPGRRSVAALTAVRAEARWADVVLFHGVAAVPPGARLLRGLPRCVLLTDRTPPARLLRASGDGSLLVVCTVPADAATGTITEEAAADPGFLRVAATGDPAQLAAVLLEHLERP